MIATPVKRRHCNLVLCVAVNVCLRVTSWVSLQIDTDVRVRDCVFSVRMSSFLTNSAAGDSMFRSTLFYGYS